MERERQPIQRPYAGGGDAATDVNLDEERVRLHAMLDKADQLLDSITAHEAEEYLQQSRQRSAQ